MGCTYSSAVHNELCTSCKLNPVIYNQLCNVCYQQRKLGTTNPTTTEQHSVMDSEHSINLTQNNTQDIPNHIQQQSSAPSLSSMPTTSPYTTIYNNELPPPDYNTSIRQQQQQHTMQQQSTIQPQQQPLATVTCPRCHVHLKFPNNTITQIASCPHCNQIMQFPLQLLVKQAPVQLVQKPVYVQKPGQCIVVPQQYTTRPGFKLVNKLVGRIGRVYGQNIRLVIA